MSNDNDLPRFVARILNAYLSRRLTRLIRNVPTDPPTVTRRIVLTRTLTLRYLPRRAYSVTWTSGPSTVTTSAGQVQVCLDRIRSAGFAARLLPAHDYEEPE